MPVEVSIEYCGGWGYRPRFQELAEHIKSAVPGAKIDGFVGRSRSFEVKVNGVVIHSKAKDGSFPDFKEVAAIVKKVDEGGEPTQVQKTHSSCTIL